VTNGAVHARVAGSRGFIEWIAGDLPAIPQAAHASNIYGKLQVNGRREAVAKATRLGLL
jgi:hypothetical protein